MQTKYKHVAKWELIHINKYYYHYKKGWMIIPRLKTLYYNYKACWHSTRQWRIAQVPNLTVSFPKFSFTAFFNDLEVLSESGEDRATHYQFNQNCTVDSCSSFWFVSTALH